MTIDLPKWQCHKIVEAFQIVDALADRDGLTLRGRAGLSVTVGADYVQRLPADGLFRGGYFVRYGDGYESFSPQAAFEAGYSRLFAGEEDTTKSQAIKS